MKQTPDWIEKREATRMNAEQLLAGLTVPNLAAQPIDVLMHELLVHKVELEMQVDELRQTQSALEDNRELYLELYELAPVGYLILGQTGLIIDINLTGATMLGVERSKLALCPFGKYVAANDGDRWHRLFMLTLGAESIDRQALVLEMQRADGSTFSAYVDCRRRNAESMDGKDNAHDANAPTSLLLTLIDIDKIKQAEAELAHGDTPNDGR